MPWFKANKVVTDKKGQKAHFKYNDIVSRDFTYNEKIYQWAIGFQLIVEPLAGKDNLALHFWACFSDEYFSDKEQCMKNLSEYTYLYDHILAYMNEDDFTEAPNLSVILPDVQEGVIVFGRAE